MCFAGAPGLLIGAASAAAQEIGKAQAATVNADMAVDQARFEHSAQARQMLIETDAANKEAYKASQERDRAISAARTEGAGMQGTTMGERHAEQSRQGFLSIANAKDRAQSAAANYMMSGKGTEIKAANDIRAGAVNPLTSFTNIATGGLDGYARFKPAESATANYRALG